MPTPFDKLTIAQIQQAVQRVTPADYACNAKFYGGDHWQEGAGWIGPQPPLGDPGAAQVMAEIRKAFTSKNAIGEVVERHGNGVVGKEPAWGLTVRRPLKTGQKPNKAEQKLIDEAEALLTEWWDERGIQTLLQEAVATLLLGKRAVLRLFVPRGALTDGRVLQADLHTALFSIYAHQPDVTAATRLTDPATQQQAGVYVYTEAELLAPATGETRAEITAIDEQGRTVLRILGNDNQAAEEAEPLDLGGKLLIHELARPLLITEQVRSSQRQLNLAKTMLGRNVVQGGFLERIILNGQLPGDWVDDPSQSSGKRFVPKPFRVGAGTTNFIAGATYQDADGKTQIANPSVVYRDPVPIETFVGTDRTAYQSILEETHQVHALISGDATASGESRKQARADFAQDLLKSKAQVDRAVRWLLETALALAAQFSGQPGRFASLRATCECRLDTGPVSADELRLNQELSGGKQIYSQETAMSRSGVEDVDAEKAKITEEQAAAQAAAPSDPTAPKKDPQTGDPANDPQQPAGAQNDANAK